jgi:DNA-binding transcriptional ArsR family regulator
MTNLNSKIAEQHTKILSGLSDQQMHTIVKALDEISELYEAYIESLEQGND